jgi:hypothetical protein
MSITDHGLATNETLLPGRPDRQPTGPHQNESQTAGTGRGTVLAVLRIVLGLTFL